MGRGRKGRKGKEAKGEGEGGGSKTGDIYKLLKLLSPYTC